MTPTVDVGASFRNHFGEPPSHQNALDLFRGEWWTRLPDECGLVASTGPARHCEDYRVAWAERQLGGFAGKRVLELGPMEGGHSFMLERARAAEVVAVEANSRAYLKCLVMKEVFGLTRTRFLLGDFIPYLHALRSTFDVGFMSGVLYHQSNPVELIRLVTSRCRSILVWTHFHDPAFIERHPEIGQYFHPPVSAEVAGFTHTLHRKSYGPALNSKAFCGGGGIGAWMSEQEIVAAFEHFDFKVTEKIVESNPHSPALLFIAERRA